MTDLPTAEREAMEDEREWTAVGEQEGAARAGETMWKGPYLKPGERVTVVSKARLVSAAERVAELERDLKDAGRREAELDAEAEQFEQRERVLREALGGLMGFAPRTRAWDKAYAALAVSSEQSQDSTWLPTDEVVARAQMMGETRINNEARAWALYEALQGDLCWDSRAQTWLDLSDEARAKLLGYLGAVDHVVAVPPEQSEASDA